MQSRSIILSDLPSLDPAPPTVSELLASHAREAPGRVAMRFEGRETSYREFDRLASLTAGALAAEGVGLGSRICYIGKTTDTFFVLMVAAARLGAVIVPVGWRLSTREKAFIVADTEAVLIFSDRDFLDEAKAIAAETPRVRAVINVEGGAQYDGWLAKGLADWSPADEDCDRVFIQLYTSGTTGQPKGVMLTSRNFFAMRLRCRDHDIEWDRWSVDDVAWVAMPIAHVGGSGYGIITLFHGATMFIEREFAPQRLIDAIAHQGVNRFFAVPTALQMAIRAPGADKVDYSRISTILYGSSPMPLPLLQEAMGVMNARFAQQYGLTETAGTVVALDPADHDLAGNERMRSAGRPLPAVDIKIVDADGEIVPLGAVGEILTRSDSNMPGYWNRPEDTARTITEDGWLRTGDAGYLDADGYLFICDRIKDMICSGGENVYAAEVESVLAGHPAIAQVSVIGVPDDKWGEAVKAFVVVRPGHELVVEEVIAWARTQMANFKVPKTIDVLEALPINANGKVMKQELRRPYWQGRDRQVN